MRRGLCVGFTGAGGTGKTVTAEAIGKAANLTPLKSASRIVYEHKLLTEDSTTLRMPVNPWPMLRITKSPVASGVNSTTVVFPGDNLSDRATQGRMLIRLTCSRTCVVTSNFKGSPFLTINGSGENSPG